MFWLWSLVAAAQPSNIEVVPQVTQGAVTFVLAGREGDPLFIDGWKAGVLPLETDIAEGFHELRVEGEQGKVVVARMVALNKSGKTVIDLAEAPPPVEDVGPAQISAPPPKPEAPPASADRDKPPAQAREPEPAPAPTPAPAP